LLLTNPSKAIEHPISTIYAHFCERGRLFGRRHDSSILRFKNLQSAGALKAYVGGAPKHTPAGQRLLASARTDFDAVSA